MGIALPLTSPCCVHHRVDDRGHTCAHGGKCEPAYADKVDLSTCTRVVSGQRAFKRAYRKGERVVAAPGSALPCVHLGDRLPESVECLTCPGQLGRANKQRLRQCAVHGQCVERGQPPGVASCAACRDKLPGLAYQRPVVRNLLYHVCPFRGNGVWQKNVEQLLRRIDLFNGRRVVAVVTGANLDPADDVKRAFGGRVHDWVISPNDPSLREVVTFLPLLERVQTLAPHEVTFYAHAKGVTRPPGSICHRWTEVMYEACLDYWPLVQRQLLSRPITGCFKKTGWCFSDGDYRSKSAWHYSGSFYWLRSALAFNRDWRQVDQRWWGNESWPGVVFRPDEGGCLFHGASPMTFDLYDEPYFRNIVEPAYAQWRADRADDRRAP